jgi:chorismate synthase
VKPISTLARPLPSADLGTGEAVDKAHYERSDISVVPAAGVVAEAMVMLTVATFVLEKFGGDTVDDVRAAVEHYRARIAEAPEAPVAGGRRPVSTSVGEPTATHGLTGTDEAGSGGDD